MSFELQILGSNSAAPAHNRHQTSQLFRLNGHLFLIDCGEGTQMQLSKYKAKAQRINHILISHLHGDHYLGLMGLLSTMHLQNRQKELFIYGPPGLSEILTLQLKYSQTVLNYKIHFKELDTSRNELIYEDELITIETIPLNHRIPCAGFLFREKRKRRRINKNSLPADLSLSNIIDLKNGKDIVDESGNILHSNESLTLPPKISRSYAYCSDTKYDERILAQIQGVNLLYHEATFLSDRAVRAKETFHATAKQAATIAKKAGVDKLVIGHYSIRYKDLRPLLDEAREVFQNTMLGIEGETIIVEE